MSIPISKSDLSPEQQRLARKLLVINPRKKDPRTGKAVATGEPFHCWTQEGDTYCLPYAFALRLTEQEANQRTGKWEKRFVPFEGQLRDYQVEDTTAARELLDENGCVLLAVYASAGKTLQASYLSQGGGRGKQDPNLSYKTVILYHRKTLSASWRSTIEQFFPTGKVTEVTKKSTPEELEEADFILCMEKRYKYILPEIRDKIGTVIVDEVHEWYTPTRVLPILHFHPRFLILCSATPDKDDHSDDVLKLLVGMERVERISEKPFKVIKLMTGVVPETTQGARGLNWSALVKSLTENEERNDLILDLVINKYKDEKIILLSERAKHVRYLHDVLQEKGEKVDYMAQNKSSYHDCRILLGTMSKIGTGFDPRTTCIDFDGVCPRVLFLLTSVKGLTRLEQNVGRVFRADDPLVIHLVDENKTVKSHWTGCAKWYQSRNGSIVKQNR